MIDRNNDYRHGSARWAEIEDIHAGGLLNKQGLPFGFFDNRLMRLQTDAPRLLLGGAGSGKLTGIISYCLCLPNSMSMAVLDPKGELWDISAHGLAAQNIFGYSWDPYQISDVHHTINPLDHLRADRITLFAEIERLAIALIPSFHNSAGRYFEITAQSVIIMILYETVLREGRIDFPTIYRVIHMIEGDLDSWVKRLDRMLNAKEDFIRSQANSILDAQQTAPKEFRGVMGELYAHMRWLADPAIRRSLTARENNQGRGDASLQEMINPALNGGHKVRFHFKVPADLIAQCAAIMRVFFDVIMMLKARNRGTDPILILVDEAAQLQKFKALLDAFVYGRGSGCITMAVFQDLGQIENNFSRTGVTSFIGSAAHRMFIGTRDLTTANMVSSMCGMQTLEYDDESRQAVAHHQMMQSVNAILDGADPIEVSQNLSHYQQAATRPSKMQRPLITPDEVLNMREDEAISFISGKNIPPIFHNKYPYFERLRAGEFFPNPNHPPINKIRVRGRWGHKWLKVNRTSVPHKYRQFPQYQSGYAVQIEGHPL